MSGSASESELAMSQQSQPSLRHLIEFFLVLLIAAIIFNVFVAQGYYVPSASMAPGLVGFHYHVRCPDCGYEIRVGKDDHTVFTPNAVCPMCRKNGIEIDTNRVEAGDRLLVHKGAYEFRPPYRWETVVFNNPYDEGAAYIKRVVGLPGESLTIRDGDVFIDGKIVGKSLQTLLQMCLPVYIHDYAARSANAEARLEPGSTPSAWKANGSRLEVDALRSEQPDTLTFRHVDAMGSEAPITDDVVYNLRQDARDAQNVNDLIVRLKAAIGAGTGTFAIRLHPSASRDFEARFHPHSGKVDLLRNGRVWKEGSVTPWLGSENAFTFAVWDQRLVVMIDNQAPFGEVPFTEGESDSHSSRPVVLVADGIAGSFEGLRIDRDVHYRAGPRSTRFTQSEEYRLGADEYLFLGDNSPISNDSRSWSAPGVPASSLVGKPVVVHLPTRIWETKVLGQRLPLAVPDIERMRIVR